MIVTLHVQNLSIFDNAVRWYYRRGICISFFSQKLYIFSQNALGDKVNGDCLFLSSY